MIFQVEKLMKNEIKIQIFHEIKENDARILEAIKEINGATSSDKVLIYFNNNAGGAVQDAVDLIAAIESSNPAVQIVLIFHQYAVSAAAFIMCYFAFYNVVTPNVRVELDGPVCVVYHKPRVEIDGLHTYFASDLYHDRTYPTVIQFIKGITPSFDEVFEKLFKACYSKNMRIAPHMRSVYNMNGDVSVIFSGGPLHEKRK